MRPTLLIAVLSAVSCAAEPQPDAASVGMPEGDCNASTEAAKARVTKVVQENLACSADTDCVRVEVRASCFDACSTSVNLVGKGAVDRASTLVEAAECKKWNEAGCKLTVPPCAPPQPVRCVGGKCQ
jgi:hypothetical protein